MSAVAMSAAAMSAAAMSAAAMSAATVSAACYRPEDCSQSQQCVLSAALVDGKLFTAH